MKRNGPKLSKKLSAAKKQEKAAKNEPETVDDYIEEGAIEEESGDRWHGSDLAKALRFYQKAYTNYRKAIDIGSSDQRPLVQLAHYNASRLLFHVYTQYQRTDGVDISELTNVTEVVDAGSNSVYQEILKIVKAHETAIEYAGADAPTDLLFNAAIVYVEAIEETNTSTEIFEMASRSMQLLKDVLERQASELEVTSGVKPADVDPNEFTSPADMLDTVISVFSLVQTLYESVGGTAEKNAAVTSLVGQFVTDSDTVGRQILGNADIKQEQRLEYLLGKTYASAASCASLKDVFAEWDNSFLPQSPERYMSAADCIESFMSRTNINSPYSETPEEYWDALTKMDQYFKQAHEMLNTKFKEAKASPASSQTLGLGSIISQIAKVCIARSDIDLQRSHLPLEKAVANSSILQANAKAFVKSAMNMAKQSGGMRETIVEKVQRERRRIEAVCRLCALERKASEQELDTIVGAGRWQSEIENMRELWVYFIYLPHE
ncbi:hypothetical protein OXX80_003006 [Metschnikowia pulcherrima]